MLVYVNNFLLDGEDQEELVLQTIAGWLQKITNLRLSVADLKSGNEYREGVYAVRCFSADRREPALYSVLLTHRDEQISGRSWATEISLRREKEGVFVSILLQTQEQSTQVAKAPEATRPMLINYLANNCAFTAETAGRRIRTLNGGAGEEAEYESLLYEIERKERAYPLVLVSCEKERNLPLIEPKSLQRQLFGLAQVVFIEPECDSWLMARILGKNYAAWGGAVNIISPYAEHKGFCYTNLLRKDELEELDARGKNLAHYILSLITHRTNLVKKREHFSPADVRAKRQKDYLLYLRENSKIEDKNDKEQAAYYKQLFEAACEEQKEIDEQIEKLKAEKEEADNASLNYLQEKEDVEKRLKDKEYQVESLSKKSNMEMKYTDITEEILLLSGNKIMTPKICLELASKHSDNLIILESAVKAAEKASEFKNTQKLLDMLYRLGGEYLEAYLQGGDNAARSLFGDAYSARESETTMRQYPDSRNFIYKDKIIPMWQHLRIGVADNERETIRVHFAVRDRKIIIGYCGEHLPISSV